MISNKLHISYAYFKMICIFRVIVYIYIYLFRRVLVYYNVLSYYATNVYKLLFEFGSNISLIFFNIHSIQKKSVR